MTPIARGYNLGPVTAAELRAIGIDNLEQLRGMGWQEAWARWCERFPARTHTMAGYALAGAEYDIRLEQLPPDVKEEVRRCARRLKAQVKDL